MESGFIIKWGRLVPGRERDAIELFGEAKEYWDGQFKAGNITYVEPFFFATGDLYTEGGFWLIKGERDKLMKLVEEEGYLWLVSKAQFVVDHLQVEWLTVGEAIFQQVERTTKAAAEFVTIR